MSYTVGVLTISDKGSQGLREDVSGPAIQELVRASGGTVVRSLVIPDEADQIARTLAEWSDGDDMQLLITTGGTGVGPRDVTPEATKRVIEREVPGMAEVMRMESLKKTPMAMLSRAVVGIRGKTLIVNLPGSPKAVRECLEILLPVIPHALQVLSGPVEEHPV